MDANDPFKKIFSSKLIILQSLNLIINRFEFRLKEKRDTSTYGK